MFTEVCRSTFSVKNPVKFTYNSPNLTESPLLKLLFNGLQVREMKKNELFLPFFALFFIGEDWTRLGRTGEIRSTPRDLFWQFGT